MKIASMTMSIFLILLISFTLGLNIDESKNSKRGNLSKDETGRKMIDNSKFKIENKKSNDNMIIKNEKLSSHRKISQTKQVQNKTQSNQVQSKPQTNISQFNLPSIQTQTILPTFQTQINIPSTLGQIITQSTQIINNINFTENYAGLTQIYNSTTDWNDGNETISYLDRHVINCDRPNSAINSFKLQVDYSNMFIRYLYSCVQSSSITNTCRDYSTARTPLMRSEVNEGLRRIARHTLNCTDGEVIKKFKLSSNNFNSNVTKINGEDIKPEIWYDYTCCNALSIDLKYFENQKTEVSKGRYHSLDLQNVNVKDFNVMKSFNLVSPDPTTCYYTGAFYVLLGQISPSFPDYCNNKSLRKVEHNSNSNNNLKDKSKTKTYLGRFIYLN